MRKEFRLLHLISRFGSNDQIENLANIEIDMEKSDGNEAENIEDAECIDEFIESDDALHVEIEKMSERAKCEFLVPWVNPSHQNFFKASRELDFKSKHIWRIGLNLSSRYRISQNWSLTLIVWKANYDMLRQSIVNS